MTALIIVSIVVVVGVVIYLQKQVKPCSKCNSKVCLCDDEKCDEDCGCNENVSATPVEIEIEKPYTNGHATEPITVVPPVEETPEEPKPEAKVEKTASKKPEIKKVTKPEVKKSPAKAPVNKKKKK